MSELKTICEGFGFATVRNYIASGSVVFAGRKGQAAIKAALEARLEAYAGKPVGVLARSAAEMARVAVNNLAAPNHGVAIFLDRAPPADTLSGVHGWQDEEIRLGRREIDIHYPQGMGRSKLVIAAAKTGYPRET